MDDYTEDPDETGVTPVSEDGAGVPEESGLRVHGDEEKPEASGGGSAKSRGEDFEGDAEDPEDEATLFPMGSLYGDPKMTIGKMIKRGIPVTISAKLSNAAVPNRGGLFDPEEPIYMLVKAIPGGPKPIPTRKTGKGEYGITGWELVQDVRVEHVEGVTAEVATRILAEISGQEAA